MKTISRTIAWVIALALQFTAGEAIAHRPSQAFIEVVTDSLGIVSLQWDVALRDLDMVLDLDINRDGKLTWGEVRAKRVEAWHAVGSAISIAPVASPAEPCVLATNLVSANKALSLVRRSDGAFMRLAYQMRCSNTQTGQLKLHYRLFESFDAAHRVILRSGQEVIAIRTGSAQTISLVSPQDGTKAFSSSASIGSFVLSGLHHILIGWDHLAFLLALLLSTLLLRSGISPSRQTSGRMQLISEPVRHLLLTITAFTLAHSITLSLAVTGYLKLTSPLVEVVIAVSVVIAAASNLVSAKAQMWHVAAVMAFVFGLVHGLGFANVMTEVASDTPTLLWSLAGFNLGVELGQLMFVAIAFPVLSFFARAFRSPTRFVRFVSVLLIGVGLSWSVERTIDSGLI